MLGMDQPDAPDSGALATATAATDDTFVPGTLAEPVPTRARHDGWTPDRQHRFIQALAESGCVTEACQAVGMTTKSAYRLRTRPDASIFRQAWDIALDAAVRRLTDAVFSRAIHGVPRPIFYQGEQIGERRHYDERLAMFLLRYRDPSRYGAWLDSYEARRHPDGPGIMLAHALNSLMDACHGFEDERADPERPVAEGPPPSASAAARNRRQGFTEDMHHIMDAIEAGLEAEDAAAPEAQDMRDPLTALRPLDRSRSGFRVP
jgi:hypothetical protein